MTRDVALESPPIFFIGAEVFDVFTDPTGQKIANDRKSIAGPLTNRASDKTLEIAEVDAAHKAILTALEKTLPATVRR